MLDSPESATLAVTIIPVSLVGGVATPGIYSVTTESWPTVAAAQPSATDEDAITAENFSEADVKRPEEGMGPRQEA